MSMIEKYLFDHSFDVSDDLTEESVGNSRVAATASAPTTTRVPQAPKVLQESAQKSVAASPASNDTEPLSSRGYEEGFQEGFQKGRAFKSQECSEVTAALVTKVSETLEKFYAQLQKQRLESIDMTLLMVRQIVSKVFPSLLDNSKLAFADLRKNLEGVLQNVQKKSIKITVHPEMVPFVSAHFKTIPDLFFDVLQDATLLKGDCRIVWDETGVDILKKRLLDEVSALLSNVEKLAKPET